MKAKILIIDDEKSIRITVKEFLLKEGHDVFEAESFEETIQIIDKEHIDVVLSDIVLKEKSGIDILRNVNEKRLNCPVIMFTGVRSIDSASEAVRLGAFDYIAKPLEKERLLRVVNLALSHKTLVDERNRNHANLKAIFLSVKDAIIAVDMDLRIIEINEGARNICGIECEDALGMTLEDSIRGLCCGHCIEAINKTILEKLPVETHRTECEHKEHQGQLVSLNTYPLIDEKDGRFGCVMVVKDETHVSNLEKEMGKRQRFFKITGDSIKMQRIYSLMENLYNIDTTVLITGESGTGKGLIAEALHYGGIRSHGPFVKVDCSALTETLLESELFGHTKGAFTGAVKDKIGRFKKADGGTLFLDEIGDVSLGVQQRLLRVIQDKEFECVGDSTPVKVDVRIVTATNQNLKEKVRRGKFREDLYYRLKVVTLSPPPLRDRIEDIPLLVDNFVEKFNHKLKKSISTISNDVYKIFMEYEWPGNIRELENALEHSFVVCNTGVITVKDLPIELREKISFHVIDEKSEECYRVLQVLEKTNWNKTTTAKLLGLSRRTVYNKIKECNLHPEKPSI
ncbi:transcriptional regulator [Candidatus Scalindua japonica]|uniref:Transcriptional regulator n=1 Tax=Candidatus Scalindua japonica TaxID=1284222 RepID=A0A286TV84_9BACT|nr:sigma-54 dependent transcriptional regulator [Candidatus Scalindua japonica]GAX59830.1 transcriptional regulator [Candidatus Scalindua japonica]